MGRGIQIDGDEGQGASLPSFTTPVCPPTLLFTGPSPLEIPQLYLHSPRFTLVGPDLMFPWKPRAAHPCQSAAPDASHSMRMPGTKPRPPAPPRSATLLSAALLSCLTDSSRFGLKQKESGGVQITLFASEASLMAARSPASFCSCQISKPVQLGSYFWFSVCLFFQLEYS